MCRTHSSSPFTRTFATSHFHGDSAHCHFDWGSHVCPSCDGLCPLPWPSVTPSFQCPSQPFYSFHQRRRPQRPWLGRGSRLARCACPVHSSARTFGISVWRVCLHPVNFTAPNWDPYAGSRGSLAWTLLLACRYDAILHRRARRAILCRRFSAASRPFLNTLAVRHWYCTAYCAACCATAPVLYKTRWPQRGTRHLNCAIVNKLSPKLLLC